MPALRFTDTALRNLRLPPRPKQVPYFETMQRGLALVLTVSYGGTKSWSVVTYAAGGKARARKLGVYPTVPLKEARKLAHEAFENPAKFAVRAAVGTFKEVADNWLQRHVEKNGLRSQHEIERMLNRYVLPRWKGRSFLEIRRLDINALLDEIEDQNGRSQADAVLAVVRGICNWYQTRDENYVSPIVRGMKRDQRQPKVRSAARGSPSQIAST